MQVLLCRDGSRRLRSRSMRVLRQARRDLLEGDKTRRNVEPPREAM